MLMKQQRLDAALTQFQITLQLDPSNQLAGQYLGEIRASKHRDRPARAMKSTSQPGRLEILLNWILMIIRRERGGKRLTLHLGS